MKEQRCCEDEYGNILCRNMKGIYCSAITTLTGKGYHRMTKDAIDILRLLGCPLFVRA